MREDSLPVDSSNQDATKEQEQKSNKETLANLRQRSLLFWLDVARHKPKTIAKLYENTTIQGNLQGTDAMESKFRFDNWESPVGVYDHVVIRGTDVQLLEINFEK
ncbi:10661_t:CDS:2 [Ambispora leptoticha]|uniref:10661_t:CDS:1 n=1 Tax=Ambispora leptoticha TaxID=144679 RepID=A0A9N9AFN9_9GLOM|nr:10661_t:CDS:2 [Ambispora leptoticha]